MNRIKLIVAVCAVVSLVGCGSGSTGGVGGGSGGSGGGSGGGKGGGAGGGSGGGTGGGTGVGGGAGGGAGGGSAGGAGGGSAGGAGGGTASSTKSGSITITQTPDIIGTGFTFTGIADFNTVTSAATGSGCTTTVASNCTTIVCVPSDGGTSAVVTNQSAGVVSVTGVKGSALMISPGAGNVYTAATGSTQLWDGGEMLTASAPGAVVPAFSGKTVVAPSVVGVTAPACSLASCGTIMRSSPLAFTWTNGTQGTINASATTVKNGVTTYINCTFAATAGTGTISAAVLGQLDQTVDGGIGVITLNNTNVTTFSAGDYSVVYTATNASLAKPATFQ
jgi:hypothetical protein